VDFFDKPAKEYLIKYGTQNELNSEQIFFSRGHPFYLENDKISKLQNGEKGELLEGKLSLCDINVPCAKCGSISENGHDYCLKNLPGVKSACCGHGVHDGYITFENGVVIVGKFEIKHIEDFE
jgi:hypothetical protein